MKKLLLTIAVMLTSLAFVYSQSAEELYNTILQKEKFTIRSVNGFKDSIFSLMQNKIFGASLASIIEENKINENLLIYIDVQYSALDFLSYTDDKPVMKESPLDSIEIQSSITAMQQQVSKHGLHTYIISPCLNMGNTANSISGELIFKQNVVNVLNDFDAIIIGVPIDRWVGAYKYATICAVQNLINKSEVTNKSENRSFLPVYHFQKRANVLIVKKYLFTFDLPTVEFSENNSSIKHRVLLETVTYQL